MHPLNLLKALIILLFSLLAVSISMAAAADTVVVGTITAIDTDKRELIVSPVHAAAVTGETGSSSPVLSGWGGTWMLVSRLLRSCRAALPRGMPSG